ncbi:hypothetical protein [Porticoccus sp.]|nr:MAG: hypothetical protein EP324_00950 [Gammaproteobacteria bacterium]
MNALVKKFISVFLVVGLTAQLTACGTILYPERKGQSAGRLDSGVVVLDAIGLLFFIIPGVIAFAVDFNNGSIYLPGGSASLHGDDLNVVSIDGEITNEKIEQVILEKTGEMVSLDDSDVSSSEKTVSLSALKTQVRFL